MTKVNDRPGDLLAYIKKLESRIKKLESAPRLRNASIRGGTLSLLDSGGNLLVRLGDTNDALGGAPTSGGKVSGEATPADTTGIQILDPRTGIQTFFSGYLPTNEDSELVVRREDGSMALTVYNGGYVGGKQFVGVYDQQGTLILSDDSVSGQGLARPWLPLPFGSLDMSTASGTMNETWIDLESCVAFHQHPTVYVQALVIGDSGTAGEFRLYDHNSGTQIGDTHVLGAGGFTWAYFDGDLRGAHMSSMNLSLQGQRTAGTGFIRARVVCATGRQS